ncbi:peptide-binding protein [Sedimentisphaera salicampi]|uniref:Oligopeptide-binding protein AppA n=1 Tax=Sedimentisphaera salicampi TaxID=1941349 RepID=A0A1W6LPL2_9BACT|nr:peptide-binding protein [Sedimentisphaera salicampi]ARN57738.1 Oligopeptide-binding protein AppA precursor [Sedimentisphaera salicampi]OXU14296.1 Oligopeptide-binding protein AppA precursor [Sedimentisphaera salicampi]
MAGKSSVFKFFVVLILLILVFLQGLEMKQSDRLFERVNQLEKKVSGKSSRVYRPASDADSAEAAAKDGGWLIWRLSAEPPTLNPITAKDAYADMIVGSKNCFVFETLVKRNRDSLEYEPLLAESWDISDDGLRIEFRLKDDIWFSDGEPVTAEDVKFTYETIMDVEIDAANIRNYFVDFKSCEVVNDRTVVFNMKRPYFLAFGMIGETPIIPKHVYEYEDAQDFNSNISDPVGSGPFVFGQWDVGDKIVLEKNENYWGEGVNFEKLIYKFISNDMAALTALKSGQIDVMAPLPEQYTSYKDSEQFKEKFNIYKYLIPDNSYTYVSWNFECELFQSGKVRNALTHLIDREKIKDHIWEGLVRIVSGPFSPGSPQCNPNVKPLEFSPDKARELLSEAGWEDTNGNGIRDKNGREFKFKLMIVSGSPITEQTAKVLKDQFSQAGIIMEVDPFEWSVFLDRLHKRDFEATTLAWQGDVETDPYQIWHSSQIAKGGSNYISYKNETVDNILEEARRTLDDEKRNRLYHRFHKILNDEQPYTFMFARPSIAFMNNRIKGVKVHKLGVNIKEWYIPSELQKY